MLFVGFNRPADLGVANSIVVCCPRKWEHPSPERETNPGYDEQQREGKQFPPAESEPAAIGLRPGRLGLGRVHVIFLSNTSGHLNRTVSAGKGLPQDTVSNVNIPFPTVNYCPAGRGCQDYAAPLRTARWASSNGKRLGSSPHPGPLPKGEGDH